jgi:hypothetical protein
MNAGIGIPLQGDGRNTCHVLDPVTFGGQPATAISWRVSVTQKLFRCQVDVLFDYFATLSF